MSRGTTGSAGDQLRALREAKGMGLRDVARHSREIAAHLHVDECFVSHQYLSALEADCHKPGVYKLYTLSRLYGTKLDSLLKLYGMGNEYIVLAELGLARLTSTEEAQGVPESQELVHFPETSPASSDLDQTQLLLGGADVSVRAALALLPTDMSHPLLYGMVGRKDLTMDPLLRPGALLQIDSGRRRVEARVWRSELERPIFFLKEPRGYACGWCEVKESCLSLIPYPLSPVRIRQFRYPGEVEIIGQVTGVAMSLATADRGWRGLESE